MGANDHRLTATETAIEQRDKNGTTSGTNSSTATTETKRRGRPPGTKREETILPGLATVNQPKAVEIEIPGAEEQPKKKAGRPKGSGSKTPAKSQNVDSTQIQLLLVTVSGLIASRPGMEVWNLTAEESKQIAEPLAKILSKNQALASAVGEHADAFALVTACFMVFVPKLILYMATKPKKPKEGKKLDYGTGQPTKPQNEKGTITGVIKSNDGQHANGTKNGRSNFGGQLSQLVSPVGGF